MRCGLRLLALVNTGVLVAFLVGFYAENRNDPLMPAGRWLGWSGYTVLLGVFVVRDYWRHWRRVSFWLVLAGLFAVHTALYAVGFHAIQAWRSIWFLPISIAEYATFVFTLDWLGYRDEATGNSRSARRSV